MANLVLYFTGTGNSLWAARQLAAAAADTEIKAMAGLTENVVLPEYERIGLVFPVYCWGIPPLVRDFCQRVTITGAPYIFSVATCSSMPGLANRFVGEILNQQGQQLAAGFVLPMVGNYPLLAGAPAPAKSERLLARAEKKLEKIIENVVQKRTCAIETSWRVVNVLSHLLYPLFCRYVAASDHRFWANRHCSRCGLCMQICPVGNIVADAAQKPVWQGNCQQCMSCLQFCPHNAIQFGWLTSGRRRYRHPNVTSEDIIAQKRPWKTSV